LSLVRAKQAETLVSKNLIIVQDIIIKHHCRRPISNCWLLHRVKICLMRVPFACVCAAAA